MPDIAIERVLPGTATQRDNEGKVRFVRGTVQSVTQYSILIQTDSKELGQARDLGFIRLIGETYIYWCPRCQMSVWEVERLRSRGACPKCRLGLCALQAGDRVRLHFRSSFKQHGDGSVDEQGTWGAWYGEKVV